MEDETPIFAATAAALIKRHGPDSNAARVIAEIRAAHDANQARRAAVLRHDDLAAELTRPPLDYRRPEQWTGYIPPATFNLGTDELLRDTHGWSQPWGGRRAMGTVANDSPRRAALLDLSDEAWQREQAPAVRKEAAA